MAVTLYNINKWYKMLAGKSVWHVNQDIGKFFSKNEIKGYYNNMTEKVTMMPHLLDTENLPQLNISEGKLVDFPVAIFQYGLGAYDLYLQTKDDRYRRKCVQCAEWAINHLDKEGRWNNFFYVYPENPYGAMAQGEGVSLMLRVHIITKDEKYLHASKRAIDYMLKPMEQGGTTNYNKGNTIFMEYTHLPVVMNGWIFAWWGLYDYVLFTNDKRNYKHVLDKSLSSLMKYLPLFSCSYWSKYDSEGKIASPFYHNLHIAQMQAMYELTGENIFRKYSECWVAQQRNPMNKGLAFIKKVYQKIIE